MFAPLAVAWVMVRLLPPAGAAVKFMAWLAVPVYNTLSVTVAVKVPLPVDVGI